jgi:fructose-1,6-bisphosphatase/inositol monophosphatase family enzyme
MDPIMNIWDIAPLKPIITEARGVFTNLDRVDNAMGTSSVAYNSMLHKELMDLI